MNVALETARKDKLIGNSLGARVSIRAGGELGRLLESRRRDLAMLFIVSEVQFARSDGDELSIEVSRAEGTKCPRCWRMVPALVAVSDGEICDRCTDAVQPRINWEWR